MKNKNLILTILGVTILIIATVGITTLLYKNEETTLSKMPRKKYDILVTSDDLKNKKSKFEYNDNYVEIVTSQLYEGNVSVKINHKYYELSEFAISSIDFIGDLIIIVGSGTDVDSRLYIFNNEGNLLSNPELVEKEFYMYYDYNSSELYEISDNKILLYGTRETHGPSLVSKDGWIDLEICENIEKYKGEIVRGTYEIEYLGNGKFTEPTLIEYEILDEIKDEYLRYCISE